MKSRHSHCLFLSAATCLLALQFQSQAGTILEVDFEHWNARISDPDGADDGDRVQDKSGTNQHGFWGGGTGANDTPIIATPLGTGVDSRTKDALVILRDALTVNQADWNPPFAGTTPSPYFKLDADKSYTFEMVLNWMGNSNGNDGLMGQIESQTAGDTEWWIRENSGTLQFLMDDSEGTTNVVVSKDISGLINNENWHHVAIVLDRVADEVRIYFDYELIHTDTNPNIALQGNIGDGAADIRFGAYNTTATNYFDGLQDHYRVSDAALAPAAFIQIPGPGRELTWTGLNGASPDGTWDLGTTATWKDATNQPAVFENNDLVTFDDSAATSNITLTGLPITPWTITFANNTLPYTLAGTPWSGSASLTKSGTAKLTLAIDAAHTGGTTISAGTLQVGNGGNTGALGTGAIVNQGALVVSRDGTLTLGGGISGTGTLEIQGPGTTMIAGNNTYTGTTIVTGGTLRAAGTLASPVTVQSGATLAPGPAAVTGTANLDSLTLAAGSKTRFRAGFTNSDSITVTSGGGLSIVGTHSIDLAPTELWLPLDEFALFSYNTSYTGNIADLKIGTAPHGSYSILDDTSNGKIVVRVNSLDTLVWKGTVDTLWNIDQTANWQLQSNSSQAKFFAHDQVRFDASASTTTVTVAEPVPVAKMLFEYDAPTAYLIQGNGSLGGAAALTKSGSGSLTLATANSFTGPVDVTGGTLILGNPSALGTGPGIVRVEAGAVLDLNGISATAKPLILEAAALTNTSTDPAAYAGTLEFFTDSTIGGSGDITLGAPFSGPGNFLKTGAGTLTTVNLATDSNSFTGHIMVNQGTLNLNSIVRSAAGLTVNQGAAATIGRTNMFVANHGVAMAANRVLTANAGTLVMNSSMDSRFGNITLHNGGTFTSDRGLAAWDALFGEVDDNGTIIPATLAVTGTGTATMNGSGGIHLGGVQNFQVADTTGNPDTDLAVDMILDKRGNNPGPLGGVNKLGAGTMRINSICSYDGATQIIEGTLVVAGSLTATSAVTVASGATLGGNGNIGGPVTIQSGGNHSLEIAAAPASQTTRTITGTLTLEAGNILTLTTAATPANGTYILATATGGITGTPTTVNLPSGIPGPATVTINGNNLILTVGNASDYDTWASTFPGFTDNAPGSDPDNDGFTNFEEYAFGLNPTSGSPGSPVTAPNKTAGTFTYTRRRQSLTGLDYSYKSSTTLPGWSAFTPVSAVSDNGNPVETITVTLPTSLLSADKLFLRVEAVKP
jgi:autotransporter-associated beta strand protein